MGSRMPKPLKLSNQVDGHRQERLDPRSLTTPSVSPTSLTTHMGMMMVVMMVMMMVITVIMIHAAASAATAAAAAADDDDDDDDKEGEAIHKH